jgi:membrane protein YqaA with SNARE-associated domain
MTNKDRAELQVAAVIGAVLGAVTGYLLSNLVESSRLAQNTYLGTHWCSRRQWHGFLSSGFSFVNARPSTDEDWV